MENLNKLSVGHKIFFTGEKLPMAIMARNERYIVCSRKLSRRQDADLLWHEVNMSAYCTFTQAYEGCKDFPVYSILDLQKNERAPDNYGAYCDYFNHAECRNAVKMLESGRLELSHRNKSPLSIDYDRTFNNIK